MRIPKASAALAVAIVLAGMVAACLAARHVYFHDKLLAADPVAIHRYAADNAALAAEPAGRPRVVLIGDSRIHSMKARALEPQWQVIQRGIPGETAAQMRLRFPDDAMALKPAVVVIQSGINDLVAGMASAEVAPEISRKVVEHLKVSSSRAAAAGARVYLLTIIPPADPGVARRLVWSERIRDEVSSVNEELLRWKAPPGVTVVDCGRLFGSPTRLPDPYVLNTLHLNATGYAKLEGELAARIGGAAN